MFLLGLGLMVKVLSRSGHVIKSLSAIWILRSMS